MSLEAIEVVRCPPQLVAEALSLVLVDIVPSERRTLAGNLLTVEDPEDLANEPLYVAMRGQQLQGAAWGQRQSGNFAVFWPPQFFAAEDEKTAHRLAEAVVQVLDDTAVEMTQVLVSPEQASTVGTLTGVGFRHLADLLYLTCESQRFPIECDASSELEFLPYDGTLRSRLIRLIERTYEDTLDCTALNGVRQVDNVVNGYQSTGTFRPENWLIVRAAEADVGLLLLADHPKAGHFELMYMGLVPEVRGNKWGRQITRYAQWMAGRAGVQRIVLAVDAGNVPALEMYRSTGFEIWDRRTVYVRFPGGRDA